MIATDDRSTVLLRWSGALAASAAVGYALPALAFHLRGLRAPLGIEDRARGGGGYALTFDDGPHAQGTPQTLEILAGARVRATFFLVGEQVQRNPGLAAEIVAAGTRSACTATATATCCA